MAIPVVQVTASVVIALFLLQLVRSLLANSESGIAKGIEGGLSFLFRG